MLIRAIFADSPLLDDEADGDPVALLRRRRHRDLGPVAAARDVLALHSLLGTVERGPVEDPRLGEADVLQRFLQRLGVELLVAGELDLADRRPLLHQHDRRPAPPAGRRGGAPYSALTACAAFSSSIRSPTLTSRCQNTVPASVRWTPSTRMSRTTKGVNASAGTADQHASSAASSAGSRRATAAGARGADERQSVGTPASGRAGEVVENPRAINIASTAMPMRWPTSNVRSETGLPLMSSAR